MRISSKRSKNILALVYILCILAIIVDVLLIDSYGAIFEMFNFSLLALLALLILVYRGLPVFYYDSDGEVLNFTAEEPNLQWMGKVFVTHFEFPKRKLSSFRFKSYPLRRTLSVTIKSKGGKFKKQRISISYLSRKEVKDLKKSLNGVIERNEKA